MMQNPPPPTTPGDHPHGYRYFYCTGCGYRIVAPIYCGHRFCPVCSRKRAADIRRRLNALCAAYPDRGGLRLKMLTLTVRTMADPAAQARHLVASFRRLRRTVFWRDSVTGGAFVLEATQGSAGFHIHLHALVYSHFLPFSQVKSLWQKVSGSPGVYITTIPGAAAAAYLTKYLSKSVDDYQSLTALSDALRQFRLFQPFGEFHGKLPGKRTQKCVCPHCGGSIWIAEERLRYLENHSISGPKPIFDIRKYRLSPAHSPPL